MDCNDGKPVFFDALSSSDVPSDGYGKSSLVGISFVNEQVYRKIAAPDEALISGTMFCELDKPYAIPAATLTSACSCDI